MCGVNIMVYRQFNPSYYEILGVTEHATAAEIKTAYKKFAVKGHPDKCGSQPGTVDYIAAEEKFKLVSTGYTALMNDKAEYDSQLRRHGQRAQSQAALARTQKELARAAELAQDKQNNPERHAAAESLRAHLQENLKQGFGYRGAAVELAMAENGTDYWVMTKNIDKTALFIPTVAINISENLGVSRIAPGQFLGSSVKFLITNPQTALGSFFDPVHDAYAKMPQDKPALTNMLNVLADMIDRTDLVSFVYGSRNTLKPHKSSFSVQNELNMMRLFKFNKFGLSEQEIILTQAVCKLYSSLKLLEADITYHYADDKLSDNDYQSMSQQVKAQQQAVLAVITSRDAVTQQSLQKLLSQITPITKAAKSGLSAVFQWFLSLVKKDMQFKNAKNEIARVVLDIAGVKSSFLDAAPSPAASDAGSASSAFRANTPSADSGNGSESEPSSPRTEKEAQAAVAAVAEYTKQVLAKEGGKQPGKDVLDASRLVNNVTEAVKKRVATVKDVAAIRDAALNLPSQSKSALSRLADALSVLLSFVVKAAEVTAFGMSSMMGGGLGYGMFGQRARAASRIQEPGHNAGGPRRVNSAG